MLFPGTSGKTLPLQPAIVNAPQPQPQSSVEDIEVAVAKLSDFVQSVQRNLSFSVDDITGDTVITVTDRQTEEVVRQIPGQYLLDLARNLNELQEKLESSKGNLFEARV